MAWTDEVVEQLKQHWIDGKSASQIAGLLGNGVTRNAVIGKVHRLGLAGRAKTASTAASRPRRMAPPPVQAGGSGAAPVPCPSDDARRDRARLCPADAVGA
jgi:GcrA cell cycle regulator